MSIISSKKEKKDIRLLSLEQLQEVFVEMGEKSYRAKQVYQWLWQKGATSFDDMTNLSKSLRQFLDENFAVYTLQLDDRQDSNDGTIKCRFKLYDGYMIESVLIPANGRMTACVSSQVGCSLTCKFCATGKMKRMRNLEPSEIYDQVKNVNNIAIERFGVSLSNIVYMGMGEPLLNYKNVLASIEKITSPEGLGMSPKRITVSTAGIAKLIKKLADDETKFNLALSLHAATDEKRAQIMPINEQNSLTALQEALQYYFDKTKRRIFFEYITFKDFNTTIEDANHLVKFCRPFPCKVNLIEYNTVEGTGLYKAQEDQILKFKDYVASKGVTITFRRSRGKDIDAACGQLANK